MNLVIDSGNSAIKAGLFDQFSLKKIYESTSIDALKKILFDNKVDRAIVSSVKNDAEEIRRYLGVATTLILSHDLKLPFENLYKTPETLGADRVAAVAGAIQLYPNQDILVIDAGTCVTYDFIDRNKNYQGGSISAGLKMRLRAVHEFTAKLPLVEYSGTPLITGRTTSQAIESGAFFGMLAEINGFIEEYKKIAPALVVIICGGDAKFFESKIKHSIFVVPEIVLTGLNNILQYNVL